MATINHRIWHEIQNKHIVPESGGPLYLLCWSKAATTTITGRNSLWCFPLSFRGRPLLVALDQHKGFKGPPLTGTIRLYWITWQILWFITVITDSHTFPYILTRLEYLTPLPKPGPPVLIIIINILLYWPTNSSHFTNQIPHFLKAFTSCTVQL